MMTEPRRFADWPVRLATQIEAAHRRPFSWGSHDCALWAAAVVCELTGVDFAADYRGRYKSAQGAARVMARRGGLVTIANRALGEAVPVLQARRGDVVLACREGGPSLGICIDERAAFTGPDGLAFLKLTECEQAWHV